MADRKPIFTAEDIAAQPFDYVHPLEDDAKIRLFPLGHAAELKNTGVSLGHLAPGKHSFPMHRHLIQEEWIYIISGTATLRLGDTDTLIAPGDFAAFAPGGPAHKLTNTGSETLVYLMGGDKTAVEVADFPELGKRLTFTGDGRDTKVEMSPLASLTAVDMFAKVKASD